MTGPDHALLDFRHVSLARNGRVVIDDLTLRIGAAERVAIIGPNGSGKSTLVKAITREVSPMRLPGSAFTILGRERWNVAELRTLLGVVSHDLGERLAGPVPVTTAVLSGFFSSLDLWNLEARVTPAMRTKVAEVLARLEVAHLADRDMETLSSGEARRVLIGRALVHDPRALIFDEPATSLDLPAQRALRRTISRLAREGLGVVLVTHDLADVVPEVTRVILMRDGRVVGDGAPAALLTTAALSELFGERIDVEATDRGYRAR